MATILRRGLVEEGYAADIARTGDDAIWMAAAVDYDAIVLDLMLPGVDGIEACRRMRENGVWSPVLMLTARDAVGDRVAGLDAGWRRDLASNRWRRANPISARSCVVAAPSDPSSWRSATCGSTRRRTRSGAGRRR